LLSEFGDAEIASLIAPRALVVEAARSQELDLPRAVARPGVSIAAPGHIRTPALAGVRREFDRAMVWFEKLGVRAKLRLQVSADGNGPPGSLDALRAFASQLDGSARLTAADAPPKLASALPDAARRMDRQFEELVQFTQRLADRSELARRAFWAKADTSSVASWERTAPPYRDYYWNEILGRLPDPSEPLNATMRPLAKEAYWTSYEVAVPVWPDVCASGILLVPEGLADGERRPVVVCQHGSNGTSQMVTDPRMDTIYHSFGARLADLGFVVFAPQALFTNGDLFRTISRKANPLGLTAHSFMIGQHQRILEWLRSLPYVDPRRIGFYGLSYGGASAMRIPPLLLDYKLSICSANFVDWTWYTTSTLRRSMPLTRDWEFLEFNTGNTFNYADLAALMGPRPFMVERGHKDTVAPDPWVAYEYAKVLGFYSALRVPARTEIEFFDGGHEIHGDRTFEFLERELQWTPRR
jgi:hypothetical protein